MIFITGPLYSGKREYARLLLGCTREELAQRAVWDVQELAAGCGDLAALAQQLARNEVVIATEVGGGVVPVDKNERAAREAVSAACWRSARTPWCACSAVSRSI